MINTALIEIPIDMELNEHVWRVLVKLRAGNRCEDCGSQPAPRWLVSHHLSYEAHTLRNGRCLCRSCHALIHFRTPEYREAQRRAQLDRAYTHSGWKQTEETRLRRCAAQQHRRQKERAAC